MAERTFFLQDGLQTTDLGNGVSRTILAHDSNLMTVRVMFDTGAIGSPHQHPHTQATYILSGTFEFTVGQDTQRVSAGDSLIIPPNAVHGARCISAGSVLDIFTPAREDFLK